MLKTFSSGKLCCSPSERTMPSSVAAACSSKSKVTQKRLRSASPQARLMRPPNGACRTSCMPPPSSKKRSAMIVSLRRHGAQRGTGLGDVGDDLLGAAAVEAALRHQPGDAAVGVYGISRRRRRPRAARPRRPTAPRCAPGASPSQNGIVGGAPCASSTRILPDLDAADAPRAVAEQEDVARHALDREVFVDLADEDARRAPR